MPFKPEAAARTRVAKKNFVVKIITDNKIKKLTITKSDLGNFLCKKKLFFIFGKTKFSMSKRTGCQYTSYWIFGPG